MKSPEKYTDSELKECLRLLKLKSQLLTMKRTDLSTIMRRAWQIARTTGKAFAVALSKSWQLYRLTKQMRAGIVKFAYEKADGTLLKAIGTLKEVATLVKGTGRPRRRAHGQILRC